MDPIHSNNLLPPPCSDKTIDQAALRYASYTILPDSLPSREYEWHEKLGRLAKKVFLAVCFPLHLLALLGALYPGWFFRAGKITDISSLSPLARQRFHEREQKIQQIAQKVGIHNPAKISVLLNTSLGGSASASGSMLTESFISISPEWLVQPEDLPEHLSLERLERGTLSEEMWLTLFETWIWNDFLKMENPRFLDGATKKSTDALRLETKVWLTAMRHQNECEDIFEFIIGHECGHLKSSHTFQHNLARFGWGLLAFLSLGTLTPLTKKVLNCISRIHESEADAIGATTGKALGGARFFEITQERRKELRVKYPELAKKINEHGDKVKEGSHPQTSDRIRYLRRIAAPAVIV